MLDPAPRFFPGDVLVDDRLYVDGRVLASENPLLGRVDTALRSADRWPGSETSASAPSSWRRATARPPADLRGAEVLHDGPELMLLDLGTAPRDRRERPGRTVILVTDALVLACWLVAVVSAVVRRRTEELCRVSAVSRRTCGRGSNERRQLPVESGCCLPSSASSAESRRTRVTPRVCPRRASTPTPTTDPVHDLSGALSRTRMSDGEAVGSCR